MSFFFGGNMTNEQLLTVDDCWFILESLAYTKQKFQDYSYPSYEFKLQRIADVNEVIDKIRALRDALAGKQ